MWRSALQENVWVVKKNESWRTNKVPPPARPEEDILAGEGNGPRLCVESGPVSSFPLPGRRRHRHRRRQQPSSLSLRPSSSPSPVVHRVAFSEPPLPLHHFLQEEEEKKGKKKIPGTAAAAAVPPLAVDPLPSSTRSMRPAGQELCAEELLLWR